MYNKYLFFRKNLFLKQKNITLALVIETEREI